MHYKTWKHIIAKDTALEAAITMEQDLALDGVEYAIVLTFCDPKLNPPDQGEWRLRDTWTWRPKADDGTVFAIEEGTAFYNWVRGLSDYISSSQQADHWKAQYEEEREARINALREREDLSQQLRWAEARISELETDRVKTLEGELRMALSVIKMARERALKDAELLTID